MTLRIQSLIRFEPSRVGDKWNVDRVSVNVKSDTNIPVVGLRLSCRYTKWDK